MRFRTQAPLLRLPWEVACAHSVRSIQIARVRGQGPIGSSAMRVGSRPRARNRSAQATEASTASFRSERTSMLTADRCVDSAREGVHRWPTARRRRLPSRQLLGAPAHTGVRPRCGHPDRHVLGRNSCLQRADHDRWIREHNLVEDSPRGTRSSEISSLPMRLSRSMHHGRSQIGSQRLPERLPERTLAGRATGQ